MATNRRSFIKQTTLAAAAIGVAGSIKNSAFAGVPSDKINVALIGVRNMGFGILERHLETGIVNCIGLCDVDRKLLESRASDVQNKYGQKPVLYDDFRKLLENKTIDAVIIGTPDHWHCLPMVYACEAGKDVYVEKPMANSIEECNIMVKAARKYNRIVQVGQQQRSGLHWQKVMEMIKTGAIGKLRKVNIWGNFKYGIGSLKVPDSEVPQGVNFDMWLGPAPIRSFNSARFHGNWRMFWDYGGGLITDWGVHLIDMALWAYDLKTPPELTLATGKNISFKDHAHETFDTMAVTWQHDEAIITWENVAGIEKGPWDKSYGLAFIGDNATIVINREGYKLIPEWDSSKNAPKVESMEEIMQGENHGRHVANFLECIKSRKKTVCPPETGRAVAIATHAANIAARTNEYKLIWSESTQKFLNSPKANAMVTPSYRKPWELPQI